MFVVTPMRIHTSTKKEIRAAMHKKLEENYPIHIEKTFLGAHSVPIEYKNDSDILLL